MAGMSMSRRLKLRRDRKPEDARWKHGLWPARSVERFVVSFPKSGRTWLRVMMAVAEAGARGEAPERVVQEWLGSEAPRLNGAPVLFTHGLSVPVDEPAAAMSLFLAYIGDRRRIFLVRDPRDTVVSYYFASTSRARRSAFPESTSLGSFLQQAPYGIERILLFNQACSASLRDDPGPALLLAYEDLHSDAMGSLRSVLDFLEAAPEGDDVLRSAVEYGRFENMQRLERRGSFQAHNRRLVARHPDDPESYKTRRGEVGGYRDYLSAEEIAYLEERIAALQPPELGYLEPGMPPRLSVREVSTRS
ncbi:MAG: hypothetical protein A2Y55_13515 [Actinobacteria bacterium RBG_16_68_12]|nr:MAG: hypothetical protein A2Y55_13515 [Actinobacteria bacterium RBG_16_68_12]